MSADKPNLLSQLRNGQYDELDAYLNGLQAGFERQIVGEREVLDAFQAFQQADPSLGEKFSEWLNMHPNSYPAHVALAQWFLARAWDARGAGTSNLVSDRGWRGLQHFLEQAEACARQATSLTGNPLAAWCLVGLTWNTRGCRISAVDVMNQHYPDWFTGAVQENPQSYAVRRIMLLHLRAEWGGSEDQMLQFVRQQQDAGVLPQGDMQKLWAEFHSRVSHHAMTFAEDPLKAVERAQVAADLHELQAEQLFIALTGAKKPSAERQAALERYLAAADRENVSRVSGMLGWALGGNADVLDKLSGQVGEFLNHAIQAGDTEAALTLARLHGPLSVSDAIGLKRRSHWKLPDPLPGLERARNAGSSEAAEMIVHLQEPTVVKAVKDTPQKREDVLKAADLGSAEMSWRVYRNYQEYRAQFDLDDRAKYRYLLRAADAGNNDARFDLAQQLRAGRVEVGDDGVLRPVDTQPLQDSLDYAKHLLERAAAADHKGARKALENTKEVDWEAKTAQRLKISNSENTPSAVTSGTSNSGCSGIAWWRWLMWMWLMGILVRSCAHLHGGS